MANGKNAEKGGHCGREMWGKRKLSIVSKNAENKRLNRRMERHISRQEVKLKGPTDGE